MNGPGDVLSALAGLNNSGVINVNNGSSILPPFFNNIGTLNIDGTSRFVVGTPTPMGGQGYIQTANGTLGEMISIQRLRRDQRERLGIAERHAGRPAARWLQPSGGLDLYVPELHSGRT